MKKIVGNASLVLFALFILLIPTTGNATVYSAQETYSLPEDTVVEGNVYVGGQTVTINGTVTGDLIGAGGTIILNGTLEDDVILAGGTILVPGTINDDFRVAGGTVVVSGTVTGDINVASGTVTIDADAHVGGDVIIAAGTIDIAGVVDGSVGVGSGVLTVSGTIGKNLEAQSENITITDTAIINGDFSYTSENQATIENGATILGETHFTEHVTTRTGRYFGVIGLGITAFFMNLLGTLLIALVFIFYVKPLTQKIIESTFKDFWITFALGILACILTPVLAILLMITVIGIPLGILLLTIYVMLLSFALVYAGIILGAYIMKWVKKNEPGYGWQNAVIGITVLHAVMLVPIFGWAIGFVLFLTALGAISKNMFQLLGGRK